MPSKDPTIKKAYKDGLISKGQYTKLGDGMLLGIIKRKSGVAKSTVKSNPKSKSDDTVKSKSKSKSVSKKSRVGITEERKKLGKEKHKRGRPKGGSKVEIVS